MATCSLVRPISGMIYEIEDVTEGDRRRLRVSVSDKPLTVVDALELAEMLSLKARQAEKHNLKRCLNEA